jgi:hypothetical protein
VDPIHLAGLQQLLGSCCEQSGCEAYQDWLHLQGVVEQHEGQPETERKGWMMQKG